MTPLLRSTFRISTFARLAAGLSALLVVSLAGGQEPAATGTRPPKGGSVRIDKDPLRQRSATENVVFGRIVSTDDHRLTLREGEDDTETVYQLSPDVQVRVGDRILKLESLKPNTRIRFSGVTGRSEAVSEITVVEEEDSPAAEPAPTQIVRDETAPIAENETVPEVDLGATLETTPEGVEIVRIDAVSPLRDAGLKSGDFIKSAAGQSVVTPKSLFRVLNEFEGGATVELMAVRDKKEMDFSLTLPAEHERVLVDAGDDAATGPARGSLNAASARNLSNPRLLQEIRRTQEQQQAQLKYLYDGLMELARAAGVNQGIFGNPAYPFGGVLPIGGFGGIGSGGSGNNCFCTIGFDADGNPVIGVTEAGAALGVVGFNENGYPILRETTLVTPTNPENGGGSTDLNGDGVPDADTNGDGIPDDYNNDGLPDDRDGDGFPPNPALGDGQAPQQPREREERTIRRPIPNPQPPIFQPLPANPNRQPAPSPTPSGR